MFTGYVINLDRSRDRLEKFNQHPDSVYFTRISALDKQQLEHIPNVADLIFDSNYVLSAEGNVRAALNLGEICCTLSHIMAWKAVAQNEMLLDSDYAVIAEDDIILSPNFSNSLQQVINVLKNTDIDIVLLHKLGTRSSFWQTAISSGTEKINLCMFADAYENNKDGSTLYLIKKSFAKEKVEICQKSKPYWLADWFTIFCDSKKIVVTNPLLGYVTEENNSYIWNRDID